FAIIIKIGLLGIFCCFAGRQCLDKCTALAFSKIENIQKILIENFLSAHRFNFRHFFVVNDGFTVLVDGMITHINCIKQLFIKFIHVDGCLNVILIAYYVITFDWEDVKPDMYILGKALGGGVMPISCVAADKD